MGAFVLVTVSSRLRKSLLVAAAFSSYHLQPLRAACSCCPQSNRAIGQCVRELFWIRNAELPADFPRQKISNLRMAWYCSDSTSIGQIYVLAMLTAFLKKNAAKSF